jgi:hypothetical protein
MSVMDASERKRFLATLRQDDDFRAEVRRELLTEELLNLPQTVAMLIDHGAQMQRELTTVRGDVDALVTTTRQLLEITQNVVGAMQQGFAAVRQDIADVASTVAGVATTIAQVQQGFIAIDARFDQVDAEIRDLKDRPAA